MGESVNVIGVCILSKYQEYSSKSIEILKQYFPVLFITGDITSYSQARNQCVQLNTEFIFRFDTDEILDESIIPYIKSDVRYDITYGKMVNKVGKYSWTVWKLMLYRSKYRYFGPSHELLIVDASAKQFWDKRIVVENIKSERDYAKSLIRDFYLEGRGKEWYEFKNIVGDVSVTKLMEILDDNPKIKEFAEKATSCSPFRGLYYYFFENYPNDCYLDPPNMEKLVSEIERKLVYFNNDIIDLVAQRGLSILDKLRELNEIYVYFLGRPIDAVGAMYYMDKPIEEVEKEIIKGVMYHNSR